MLKTRLTEALSIQHPIIQAPMAFAAGGKLAAAVCRAGAFGLIGGAYGDKAWLDEQYLAAGNQPVGCGFITWALKHNPSLLDRVLDREPAAIFLSFGNPELFVRQIKAANVKVICQVQTLRDARHAIDCGADIVVAQGAEAGGHGEKRATLTLVPEVADAISMHSPDTLLVAAGGIGDGRGLAAALMLGADGVLVGSRFWASDEALVHKNMLTRAVEADGDGTIRSTVMDLARNIDWPERYTARVLSNGFTDQWHDDIAGLRANSDAEANRWREAWQTGDTDVANTFVGEVTGLIRSVESVDNIVASMVKQASSLLRKDYSVAAG